MIQVVGYTECDGCKDVLDIDQDGLSVSRANFIVTEHTLVIRQLSRI